jgi:two-component sensor histidine kinase
MGSRIIARGSKLRLKAASAQAIGLALHELATNAGKYGALSTDIRQSGGDHKPPQAAVVKKPGW